MIELYIRNPAFDNILNGVKKYELRLLRGIFTKINVGDNILLCNDKLKIKKKVKAVYCFNNFTDLFKNLGMHNCLVKYNNLIDGIKYLDTIYCPNVQKKYKCVALEFN